MKITKSQLKQIIKEELSEIMSSAANMDDFYDVSPSRTMADKFAAGDIANQPEGSRSELAQLFRNLLGELGEANPEEVEALADTVAALIPASGENVSKKLGLEEGIENITPENLMVLFNVLKKMAPMLGLLAIGTPLLMAIEKKLNNRELEEEGDRTAKGNVTQDARDDHATLSDDRFPIFDKKSALAALKLRGHGTTDAERKKIINKAAKYASEAAKKAREADAKKK